MKPVSQSSKKLLLTFLIVVVFTLALALILFGYSLYVLTSQEVMAALC